MQSDDVYYPFGGQIAANDACSTATEISFEGNPVGGTTTVTNMTQAVDDPELNCMWGSPLDPRGFRSVWYTFIASQNGIVTVDTVSSNYDTVVGVFTGICGTLNQVACNDDFTGLSSRVTFILNKVKPILLKL